MRKGRLSRTHQQLKKKKGIENNKKEYFHCVHTTSFKILGSFIFTLFIKY